MPKYKVTITEKLYHSVQVWAEDAEVAATRAYDIITNDSKHPDVFTESDGCNGYIPWVEEIKGDD